jgi:hypothetical protein
VQEAVKQQAKRFLAGVIASVVAVVLIMPIAMSHGPRHSKEDIEGVALLPAAAAWLLLWKLPGSEELASFRTAMLTIVLVGAGGLWLAHSGVGAPWIRETVESARFAPQAIIYVGIGLLGLLGSIFFKPDPAKGA